MVLKLYFGKIAVHENKQWRAYKVEVVARSMADALTFIANKYGKVMVKSLDEIELEEGMFL